MKIAVIGNAAGGKTRLSRELANFYQITPTHVDSIQFGPGMTIRPHADTRAALEVVASQDNWIIDGYGPLDIIEKRFSQADQIILIDLPIARHLFWFGKRQLFSLWSPRRELPPGCKELSYRHSAKVIKSMWSMHREMRPELIKILARPQYNPKVTIIKSVRDLNRFRRQSLARET